MVNDNELKEYLVNENTSSYFSIANKKNLSIFNFKHKELLLSESLSSSVNEVDFSDDASSKKIINNNQKYYNKHSFSLEIIIKFIYNQIVTCDFSYGDDPSLKYVVEDIFRKNGSQAEMAFINMATTKVFVSTPDVIEKFFALLVSLDEELMVNIINPIVLMFFSHKEEAASEGALILLEKYGKNEVDLAIARNIRDFDYEYLNEYKNDVIKYLEGKVE